MKTQHVESPQPGFTMNRRSHDSALGIEGTAKRMDRRSFVRSIGLVTTGSMLVGTQLGCGEEIHSVVPCLALATVPTPIGKMTYIKASAIGCALDCDLSTGVNKHTGGAATDDGPTINAAMAGASASNPITLLIDGSALISGLFLPAGGYWGIEGNGCTTGFFIKTGTNNDGIHNGDPNAGNVTDPGPNVPLPPRGNNVTLTNFMLNGNQGNGLNGDSTSGTYQGSPWRFAINLMNLNNIVVENVVVIDSPAYHFRFSNTGFVTVSGCVMYSSGLSTDGLHFDGPANDINISNCTFTTGDDAIALNCPEGYTGDISRVAITDCTFRSSTMVRLYTGATPAPQFKIDSVSVSNCSGVFVTTGFLVSAYGNNNPNAVLNLTAENCQIHAPSLIELTADFSSITLSGITFFPSGYMNVGGYAPNAGYAFARDAFHSSQTTIFGQSLSLANCTIQRTGDLTLPTLLLPYGSTIATLELNGFAFQDPAGTAYTANPELLDILSGTIGHLILDAISSTHIAAPVSAGGFASIGSVSGAGVLGTAWPFPDSVMANGTPYISATTGKPSIKINGVVQPYP